MPTIEQNLQYWQSWEWPHGGEEWSAPWGSSAALWQGSIHPRIAEWLPCDRILEIGVGYGRVTTFLREHCKELVGVDVTPKCIDACRRRFAGDAGATFRVTDGKSLEGLAAASFDFVFSWDALVHCDDESVRGYLRDLRAVLPPHGVAFVHHSNVGALDIPPEHWKVEYHRDRDRSVSAAAVRQWASECDLWCESQEIVDFPGELMTDCFSVLRPGDGGGEATRVTENPQFSAEIAACRSD